MVCYTDFLYPGQSRLRMHGPKNHYGSELAHQLESAVRSESRIELQKDTPVQGPVWDGTRVSGVETAEGDIAAGAVILALNGFGGNREMVEEYLGPEAAAALYYGSPNNTGRASAGASPSEPRPGAWAPTRATPQSPPPTGRSSPGESW